MEALGTGCFLERRDGTGVGNGVWTGGDVVDVVHIHDFSKNLSVDRLGDVRVKMISFGGSVDALCLRERSGRRCPEARTRNRWLISKQVEFV